MSTEPVVAKPPVVQTAPQVPQSPKAQTSSEPLPAGITPEVLAAAIRLVQQGGVPIEVQKASGPMIVTEALGSPGLPFAIYGANFGLPSTLVVAGRVVVFRSWRDNSIKGDLPADTPKGIVDIVVGGRPFKMTVA